MALDTIEKRLANIADYFTRNLFSNHSGLIRGGSDRTVGLVLVATQADVTAYSVGKGIAHVDENTLSFRNGPLVIDSKYMNNLCREAAAVINNLTRIVDPLKVQVAELDALAKARQATIATLETNVMTLTSERDAAIADGNKRESDAIAAGLFKVEEVTALLITEKAKVQALEASQATLQNQLQEQSARIAQLTADLEICRKINPTPTPTPAPTPEPTPTPVPTANEIPATENSISASVISTSESVANTSTLGPDTA